MFIDMVYCLNHIAKESNEFVENNLERALESTMDSMLESSNYTTQTNIGQKANRRKKRRKW